MSEPSVVPEPTSAEESGPKRSALAQSRSRKTRRALIRAALALWTERGFETGLEETTVDEIAKAAGVTKGTFYFHFAHKEDILLEMAWATGEATWSEAQAAIQAGVPVTQLVDDLMGSVARRVVSVPKAALLRTVGRWTGTHLVSPQREGTHGFTEIFTAVFTAAVERGDLPAEIPVHDLACMMQASILDSFTRWAAGDDDEAALGRMLRRRARTVLAGAQHADFQLD